MGTKTSSRLMPRKKRSTEIMGALYPTHYGPSAQSDHAFPQQAINAASSSSLS